MFQPKISKYECEQCGNVYRTMRKFTAHLRESHNLAEDEITKLKKSKNNQLQPNVNQTNAELQVNK
jgi:uncharacterized C2H2 Zn-finger protein